MTRRKTLLKIDCHYLCGVCALASYFSWLKEYISNISYMKESKYVGTTTADPGQTDVRITI